MLQVLLVIQLLVAIALVVVILFQRSEGGALGIGGGGGGGMMSARGTANFLTRMTTILAIAFIGLSLGLTILTTRSGDSSSVLDQVSTEEIEEDGIVVPDDN